MSHPLLIYRLMNENKWLFFKAIEFELLFIFAFTSNRWLTIDFWSVNLFYQSTSGIFEYFIMVSLGQCLIMPFESRERSIFAESLARYLEAYPFSYCLRLRDGMELNWSGQERGGKVEWRQEQGGGRNWQLVVEEKLWGRNAYSLRILIRCLLFAVNPFFPPHHKISSKISTTTML